MSQVVSIWKFTKFFALYVIVSLGIYFLTSFTIPAWLLYLFILVPFYIICLLYLINLSLKYRQKMLRYRRLPLYLSFLFQFLIILTSPTNCYGWKQGQACYSFIQTHFSGSNLTSFQSTSPHWSVVENMFPVVSFLYIISVAVFLKKIWIQN